MATYSQNAGHELGWEDEIQKEDSGFALLPEGDYRFTVEKVERARHAGSQKVPPCNKAIVTFRVFGNNGETALITEQYLLYSDFEWKLSAFFASIGLKGKEEKVKMRWMEAIGKSGVCKVYIDNYHKKTDKEGEKTGYSNKIKTLYPSYDQPQLTVPVQQSAYTPPSYPQPQQTYTQPVQTGWKPGNF